MALTIILPKLHKYQYEIAHDKHRFKLVCSGRRFGKTKLASIIALTEAMNGKEVLWVSPSYQTSNIGYHFIQNLVAPIDGITYNRGERKIIMPKQRGKKQGFIISRSGNNPDSLRGLGLDLALIDEGAFTKETLWWDVLRPAISDRQGDALFITTPSGAGSWFHELFKKVLDDIQWRVWQLPTNANPFFPAEEFERLRQTMPERSFAQEYLAQFVEDVGIFFHNVINCATANEIRTRIIGKRFAISIDWGFSNDSTVFVVFNIDDGELVWIEKYVQVDYPTLNEKLLDLINRFYPEIVIPEQNNVGLPVIQFLAKQKMNNGKNIPINPFIMSHNTKREIMDQLALSFNIGEIKIIPDPTLIRELQSFRVFTEKTGGLKLEAAYGEHDDHVVSCAIGWWFVKKMQRKL